MRLIDTGIVVSSREAFQRTADKAAPEETFEVRGHGGRGRTCLLIGCIRRDLKVATLLAAGQMADSRVEVLLKDPKTCGAWDRFGCDGSSEALAEILVGIEGRPLRKAVGVGVPGFDEV